MMKKWLLGVYFAAFMTGTAMLAPCSPTSAAPPGVVPGERTHWRHHDGKWSYYHKGDKRWYYTDGSHWFYHEKGAWRPYKFDRAFGKGFERGGYKGPEVKVIVPRHAVYERR